MNAPVRSRRPAAFAAPLPDGEHLFDVVPPEKSKRYLRRREDRREMSMSQSVIQTPGEDLENSCRSPFSLPSHIHTVNPFSPACQEASCPKIPRQGGKPPLPGDARYTVDDP